jgi:hypothetical protein
MGRFHDQGIRGPLLCHILVAGVRERIVREPRIKGDLRTLLKYCRTAASATNIKIKIIVIKYESELHQFEGQCIIGFD